MGDLLVDADHGAAGEAVEQLGSRAGAGLGEQLVPDLVELGGGHADPDGLEHVAHGVGHNAADAAQGLELLAVFDRHLGNHLGVRMGAS